MFDTLMKLDKDREVLDFYATDKRATKELLIRENFKEKIYEPACGQGHIGKVLEEHGYRLRCINIEDATIYSISEKCWKSMDTG